MNWCFAIVNQRLAEIFFDRKKSKSIISGHCYVKKNAYKSAIERKWIQAETNKYTFTWRKNKYKRILTDIKAMR